MRPGALDVGKWMATVSAVFLPSFVARLYEFSARTHSSMATLSLRASSKGMAMFKIFALGANAFICGLVFENEQAPKDFFFAGVWRAIRGSPWVPNESRL